VEGVAEMERCPHPNCCHIGTFISKSHCKVAHQMNREELFNQYGKPKRVSDPYSVVMGKEARYAKGSLYKTNF